MNRSSGFWWGIILIVLGALFLLENLDVISVDIAVRDYWPLLLVLWGIWMLTRGGPGQRRAQRDSRSAAEPPGSQRPPPSGTTGAAQAGASSGASRGARQGTSSGTGTNVFGDLRERTSADTATYATVFGDLDIDMETPAFQGGSLSTVFGDARLDLSHSTPAEGEHRVRISGVFGDTTVWLPAGTPFALSAHTLFGGIEANGQHRDGIAPSLSYRMPGFETAVRKITLDISAVFGDITVRA